MMVKEVSDIGRVRIVKSLMGEEKDFDGDPVFDREPVEILEDRGDGVSGAGEGEQVGGRILDGLAFLDEFGGGAVKDAVAVVQS